VGPSTVEKIAQLNKDIKGDEGPFSRWVNIPGWCVVIHQRLPDDAEAEVEHFKSTCCAVENFMLSMWSEGIGTKWTRPADAVIRQALRYQLEDRKGGGCDLVWLCKWWFNEC
jgi:hypothetical protein